MSNKRNIHKDHIDTYFQTSCIYITNKNISPYLHTLFINTYAWANLIHPSYTMSTNTLNLHKKLIFQYHLYINVIVFNDWTDGMVGVIIFIFSRGLGYIYRCFWGDAVTFQLMKQIIKLTFIRREHINHDQPNFGRERLYILCVRLDAEIILLMMHNKCFHLKKSNFGDM